MHILSLACLTGYYGDALLQILAPILGGPTGWGLKSYFKQHGQHEAQFIAAGMMTMFYVLYIELGGPLNFSGLALYGILLDLFFRWTRYFPSLDGYYEHLNYFWSAFWGAVPMMMPLMAEIILARRA